MNSFKISSLLAALFAAVCLTSCLSDDDNSSSGLTPAEKQAAFAQVRGNHAMTAYLIDQKKSTNSKTVYADSANVTFSLPNDSMAYIRNFPVRMLAEAISDSTLAKAVRQLGNQDITCRTGYMRVTPVTFIINPLSFTVKVNYGGKDHNVEFGFLNNNTYSYGYYGNKKLGVQIYEAAYRVDSGKAVVLPTYGLFHLISK